MTANEGNVGNFVRLKDALNSDKVEQIFAWNMVEEKDVSFLVVRVEQEVKLEDVSFMEEEEDVQWRIADDQQLDQHPSVFDTVE